MRPWQTCPVCGATVRPGTQHEHTEFRFSDGRVVEQETVWSSLWPRPETPRA